MHIGIAGPCSTTALTDLLVPVVPPAEGLPYMMLAGLARHWHAQGHEVTIFTLSQAVSQVQSSHGPRMHIHVAPQRPGSFDKDWFATERAHLRGLMANSGCDLINAHWNYEYALAALDSLIPTLVSAHDAPWVIAYHYRPLKFWFRRARLGRHVLNRCRHLSVVSPYLSAYFRRWHGWRNRISVIPNCLTTQLDQIQPQLTTAQRFSHRPPVVISLNNGDNSLKNVRTLIRAWPLVRAQFPDAQLLLYGAGFGPQDPVVTWATVRQLQSGVHWFGRQPWQVGMHTLAGQASMLVHPSRSETLGMTLVEAMYMGVPVVAGRKSSAVPWTLAQDAAGLLVDINRPAAIAVGIGQTLTLLEATQQRVAYAHPYVRATFAIPRIAELYMQEFEHILKDGKG